MIFYSKNKLLNYNYKSQRQLIDSGMSRQMFVLLEVSNKMYSVFGTFFWKFPLIYVSILFVSTITGSLVTLIVCKNPKKSIVTSSYLTCTCLDRCSVLQICYPNFVLYYAWYIIYYYIYIYI